MAHRLLLFSFLLIFLIAPVFAGNATTCMDFYPKVIECQTAGTPESEIEGITFINSGAQRTVQILRNCEGTQTCANNQCTVDAINSATDCGVCGYHTQPRGSALLVRYPKKLQTLIVMRVEAMPPCYFRDVQNNNVYQATDSACFDICPNSCSGHGTCTPTGCQCQEGFEGDDCSVSLYSAVVDCQTGGNTDYDFILLNNLGPQRTFGVFRNCENCAEGRCNFVSPPMGTTVQVRFPKGSDTWMRFSHTFNGTVADCYLTPRVFAGSSYDVSLEQGCVAQCTGCSGHGTCDASFACTCDFGYSGVDCNTKDLLEETNDCQTQGVQAASLATAYLINNSPNSILVGVNRNCIECATGQCIDSQTPSDCGACKTTPLGSARSLSVRFPSDRPTWLYVTRNDGALTSCAFYGVRDGTIMDVANCTDICPLGCSGHGQCTLSGCVCDADFSSADCSSARVSGAITCQTTAAADAGCDLGQVTFVNTQTVNSPFVFSRNCEGSACSSCTDCGQCSAGVTLGPGEAVTVSFPKYLSTWLFKSSGVSCYLDPVFDGAMYEVNNETCAAVDTLSLCPNGCSASLKQGYCTNKGCVCNNLWWGPDCSTVLGEQIGDCSPADPNACSGHGVCENNKCVCDWSYSGVMCDEECSSLDTTPCGGHGECVNRQCICSEGYTGRMCMGGCFMQDGVWNCGENCPALL